MKTSTLTVSILSTVLTLSACTSSDETEAKFNATIQNVGSTGTTVYLAVFKGMEPFCVNSARAKTSADKPIVTVILLDTLHLDDFQSDLTLYSEIAFVSVVDSAMNGAPMSAQVSITEVTNDRVSGNFQLRSEGSNRGTRTYFSARKCPDVETE